MNWRDFDVWSDTPPQYPQNPQTPAATGGGGAGNPPSGPDADRLIEFMNECDLDQAILEDALREAPRTPLGQATRHRVAGYLMLEEYCSREEAMDTLRLAATHEPMLLIHLLGKAEQRFQTPVRVKTALAARHSNVAKEPGDPAVAKKSGGRACSGQSR